MRRRTPSVNQSSRLQTHSHLIHYSYLPWPSLLWHCIAYGSLLFFTGPIQTKHCSNWPQAPDPCVGCNVMGDATYTRNHPDANVLSDITDVISMFIFSRCIPHVLLKNYFSVSFHVSLQAKNLSSLFKIICGAFSNLIRPSAHVYKSVQKQGFKRGTNVFARFQK